MGFQENDYKKEKKKKVSQFGLVVRKDLSSIPLRLSFLFKKVVVCGHCLVTLIIIIMYIYHALINALSAHMIHINLNMIFYTHVKHSPTKTIYIKYYLKNK